MPAIRVRRNKNGLLTISGIPQDVLWHITTLADLRAYDGLKEFSGPKHKSERGYYNAVLQVGKMLRDAITPLAWKPPPRKPLAELSKEQRWELVTYERENRLELERILKGLITAARQKKEQGHVR